MTNLDLQLILSEKTSFKRTAGKGPLNTNSPIWTELLCSSFFSLSLLSKSCDFSLINAGVRGVFCLPPTSRSSSPIGPTPRASCHPIHDQAKILLWDHQIQSMKKRCNAFIPDFFGVHDMYLLVIGEAMTIHDDLSAFLGVKFKPVVTNVACSGQF